MCDADPTCVAWVHTPSPSPANAATVGAGEGEGDVPMANCWPLRSFSGTVRTTKDSGGDREFGCAAAAKKHQRRLESCAGHSNVVHASTDPTSR